MVDESEILKEISHKLDQLIALTKLNNLKALEEFEQEIKEDKVYSKILEIVDGKLSHSELVDAVVTETGVSKMTVRRRISYLKDKKILIPKRDGRTICYENSGLLD